MAVKPGNKKEIEKSAGQVSPRFRVVRTAGRAHRITGRLKRGDR